MTHRDAIATLVALADPDVALPGAAAREAAAAHLARCSDCWTAIAGPDAPAHERMSALYGCDAIRDGLFELAALDAAAIARRAPAVARHLGWCHACRGRLAELVAVEREVAAGWAPVLERAGERVREAIGRLVLRAGRAVSGIAEIPDAFTVLAPALAGAAVRGPVSDATDDAASLARTTRFTLGDRGPAVLLDVEPAGEARVALRLRLADATGASLSFRLFEMRPDGETLVARQTVRGAEPAVVRDLWPAAFVVELHEADAGERYRVRLDIRPSA